MSDVLSAIVAATKAQKSGRGWQGACPAHEDRSPSLSISNGRVGVVLHCHAGCSFESIVEALGYRPRDLFHDHCRPALLPAIRRGEMEHVETIRQRLAAFSSEEMRAEMDKRKNEQMCPRCSSGNFRVWGEWAAGRFYCLVCAMDVGARKYEEWLTNWQAVNA